MKNFLLALSLCASVTSFAQLNTGVYARDTLLSFGWYESPYPNGCYSWEIDWGFNLLPYVTGMDMYLHFDSVPAGIGSAYYSVSPSWTQLPVVPGDSIQITSPGQTVYFYHQVTGYIGVSLVVAGIPQVSMENYFCYYSSHWGPWWDGCGNIFHTVSGGGGMMDTNKFCAVDAPMDLSGSITSETIQISQDRQAGTVTSNSDGNITIIDLSGRIVVNSECRSSEAIDVSFLSAGSYIVNVNNDAQSVCEQIIITR